MPVIAARQSARVVHSLLYNSPLAAAADDKGMQVKLETVCDGIVVNPCGQAAVASQFLTIEVGPFSHGSKLIRRFAGVPASPTTNVNSKFVCRRIETTLKRAHHRRGDSRGVPIHAHHTAEGLKPEGIAQARK